MSQAPNAPSGLEIRRLHLRTPSIVLLDDASVTFESGKITLLVGASGTGKSLLLRGLAGLIDAERSDIVLQGQIAPTNPTTHRAQVGVVFQSLAIFDELSPLDNVRFGYDHRTQPKATEEPASLLQELGVPTNTQTALLSGGQRQRLAIARTLAQGPDVILYDEPTTGLDAATTRRVVQRIAETQSRHRRTCVIVTHDFVPLLPIADAVVLVDPSTRSLREIPPEDWQRLPQIVEESTQPRDENHQPRPTFHTNRLANFLAAIGKGTQDLLALPLRLLPLWKSSRWGFRYVLHYLGLVAGPSAWLYLATAGAIVGFVTTYFTFRFLPYARYTEPLLLENLLASVGFSLFRILVPVFATILIAARCGAAVASDVAGKVYGRQFDVLKTFGVPPASYWLTGSLWAFFIGTPILVALAYLAAAATSLTVFTWIRPELGPDFWYLHFHSQFPPGGPFFDDAAAWWLAKVLLCGLGTAHIAYICAVSPKQSSEDVSHAITRTILWASLLVLVVHFAFAFVEFD